MTLFSSWFRPPFRTEHKPQAAPISTTPLSIFKGFKLGRRESERGNPQPFEKAKKSIPNRRNRPEIKVLPLVSQIPIGTPRDPPPRPPNALGTSLLNPRQHAGQHQQMQLETETNISRRIFSSTSPFRIVKPRIVDNNRAHVPPEATITLHGTVRQNLHRISRTDVALPLVQGAALAKTTPLGKHGLATIAGSDMGVQSPAVLSQPDSPLSASPNPMALKVGDSPNPPHPDTPISAFPNPTALKVSDSSNPPQPPSIHPPLGPSSLPVTASSIYEGGISAIGVAEQEGDASPPQDDDTPRLESGPSVGSFVGLRSRWSSTTNDSTTEEAPPSFLQRFRFRNSKKANLVGQTSGKAKQPSRDKVTMFKDWALPSFLQCSTGSLHNSPLPPATGLRPSQSASARENDGETSNSSPVISAVIVKTAGPIRTRGAPVDPNEDNHLQYSVVLSHANGLFSAYPIPYKA